MKRENYEQETLFFKNLKVGDLVKIKEDLVEDKYYEAPADWCWDNYNPCRICYDDVEFINPGTICTVTNVDGDGTCWLEPLLDEEYNDVWDEYLWYSFAMLEMVGTDTVCEDDKDDFNSKKELFSFVDAISKLTEAHQQCIKLEMYCPDTGKTLTIDMTGFLCEVDEEGYDLEYFTPNTVDILGLWEIRNSINRDKYKEALDIMYTTVGHEQTDEEKELINEIIQALTTLLN